MLSVLVQQLVQNGLGFLGRIVGEPDHAKLLAAVRVQLVDEMGGDLDQAAIDVELARALIAFRAYVRRR